MSFFSFPSFLPNSAVPMTDVRVRLGPRSRSGGRTPGPQRFPVLPQHSQRSLGISRHSAPSSASPAPAPHSQLGIPLGIPLLSAQQNISALA